MQNKLVTITACIYVRAHACSHTALIICLTGYRALTLNISLTPTLLHDPLSSANAHHWSPLSLQ